MGNPALEISGLIRQMGPKLAFWTRKFPAGTSEKSGVLFEQKSRFRRISLLLDVRNRRLVDFRTLFTAFGKWPDLASSLLIAYEIDSDFLRNRCLSVLKIGQFEQFLRLMH